jgi:acyl-CoA reductase-like NAD-dependent aldehyde dehydrogenase
MSSQPESTGKTTSIQARTKEVSFQDLFDKQKVYFDSDITKTYEWRIDQLDRLIRMLKENYKHFSEASRRDFKTALQENIFEVAASIGSIELMRSQIKDWMKPVEARIPKFLSASGHKGIVYREPYGVTLIMCPFNGPLVLSLRPAATALSAGNPCMLKLSEAIPATDELLLELIPKYFEPEALSAVSGHREEVAKLLQLPFDFIFLTGSVAAGRVVMKAAAEHLTPVLLELAAKILRLLTRPRTFRMQPRRLCGARWPGVGSGVLRQATPLYMSRWQRRSSRNARRPWLISTERTPRTTRTIPGSSVPPP